MLAFISKIIVNISFRPLAGRDVESESLNVVSDLKGELQLNRFNLLQFGSVYCLFKRFVFSYDLKHFVGKKALLLFTKISIKSTLINDLLLLMCFMKTVYFLCSSRERLASLRAVTV